MSVHHASASGRKAKSEIGNRFVEELPAPIRASLMGHARLESLPLEAHLMTPGVQITRLVFPTTAVCSLMIGLSSGQRAEMGTVGNEGFVGIPTVLGTLPTEFAIVQVPGDAYFVNARSFAALLDRHRPLRQAAMAYVSYAYQLAKQTAVCNAYHAIDKRLARWLLTCHDRSQQDEFPLTQEIISHMVAATRPRVAEAAGRLRSQGIIDYRRGSLSIRDRTRLERKSCECYEATKRSWFAGRQRSASRAR